MAKWGSVDYKQFKQFSERLNKLSSQEYELFFELCAKELAARLLAKVIKRTPVGPNVYENEGGKDILVKNGGTLRRGWTSKSEEEAKSGKEKNAKNWANSLIVTRKGNLYVIEVVNPVSYASYVEFGHRQEPGRFVPAIGKRLKISWVEGKYMLTISEKELENIAPRVLEKKLVEYLGECFG